MERESAARRQLDFSSQDAGVVNGDGDFYAAAHSGAPDAAEGAGEAEGLLIKHAKRASAASLAASSESGMAYPALGGMGTVRLGESFVPEAVKELYTKHRKPLQVAAVLGFWAGVLAVLVLVLGPINPYRPVRWVGRVFSHRSAGC